MIFLGIVGTKSPMGKFVLEQIKQHKELYRLCFKVDRNAKESLKGAVFTDVEDALLKLSPTMVLDFGETETAYERAKTYLRYQVPAIMPMADFTEEQQEMLHTLWKASQFAPTLVIEPTFSYNQVLIIEQALRMLNLLSLNVEEVVLNFGYDRQKDYDLTPYMPWVKKLHHALSNKTFTPQTEKKILLDFNLGYQCQLCQCRFDRIEVVLERKVYHDKLFMNGIFNFSLTIQMQQSYISMDSESQSDDIWRGLKKVIDYVDSHRNEANIQTDVLSQLVHQAVHRDF